MSRAPRLAPNRGRRTLLRLLLSSRLGRLLRHWRHKDHDIVMPQGIGRGLRFNKAGGNPDYALGTNEPPVQEALAEMLRPADVFFDIGANVGFFTVIAARLVGKHGQVIAFEPVPANAAAVRHNCALNDFANVRVLETAISDEDGTAELRLAHYAGGAALATVAPPPDLKGIITVPVNTVDTLVAQKKVPPPTVVKIDVEGAEINVLRGMHETLRQIRPIVIYEIDDESPQLLAEKAALCEAFLKRLGYQIRALEDAYPDIDWLVSHYVATPMETSI